MVKRKSSSVKRKSSSVKRTSSSVKRKSTGVKGKFSVIQDIKNRPKTYAAAAGLGAIIGAGLKYKKLKDEQDRKNKMFKMWGLI